MTQKILLKKQEFILHATGAMYWPEQDLLLISDVHLGKVNHFRKYGAAVPHGAMMKNYELLNRTLDYFKAGRLCFLGDLFHSHYNNEWHLFEQWVQDKSCTIVLVTGNHDIISPLKYEQLGIRCTDEWALENFLLTHHPVEKDGVFNLAGHIHPAVRLRGKGRQSLRLPCFFREGDQLILPAFGEFTGSHVLPVEATTEVYAITETEVVKI